MSEFVYETQGEQVIGNPKGFIFPKEEIVRCRDCKHFNIGPNTDCCGFTDKYAHPNGFCFWGERKEVDG